MKEDTKDQKEPLKRPKTYVLDTSALLEDPDIMYKLNGVIVIPLAVIKELDGLKRSDDPNNHIAMAARKVARTLERFGSYADLAKGVKLSTGGVLAVTAEYDVVDGLASEADNKIVGTALILKRKGHNVTLLTTDGNMRTVARVSGVKGEMPLIGEGIVCESENSGDNNKSNTAKAKGQSTIDTYKRDMYWKWWKIFLKISVGYTLILISVIFALIGFYFKINFLEKSVIGIVILCGIPILMIMIVFGYKIATKEIGQAFMKYNEPVCMDSWECWEADMATARFNPSTIYRDEYNKAHDPMYGLPKE